MKVPEGKIKSAILSILKEKGIVTQSELTEDLRDYFSTDKRSFYISGERARKISLNTGRVKIITETKRGGMPDKCPCCRSELKKFHMRNLYGKKMLFRMVCKRCGYEGKDGRWSPMRYNFIFSPSEGPHQ